MMHVGLRKVYTERQSSPLYFMEFLMVASSFLFARPLAVVVCIVAYMALGMLWYGPLFGKKWASLNNLPIPKKGEAKFSDMAEPFITSVVFAAIQAIVLGTLFAYLIPLTIIEAKVIATLLWLAFSGGTILSNYAWSGRPVSLRLIDSLHMLVALNLFAGILFYFG